MARFKDKRLVRDEGKKRKGRRTVLICYDGLRTEADYFRGWKRTLGNAGIVVKPIFVKSGGNVLDAVLATVEIQSEDSEHDEIWCVCDVDDTSAKDIAEAKQIAKASNIQLAISARCFEVWIALHWGKISLAPITSEKQARALVGKFHNNYLRGTKSVPFSILLPLVDDALSNGSWLVRQGTANPSTGLVDLILKLQNARV